MMNIMSRVIFDPLLPCYSSLDSTKYWANQLMNSGSKIKEAFSDLTFLRQYHHLIPGHNQSREIALNRIIDFRISGDTGISDRLLFRHDKFTLSSDSNGYRITRERDLRFRSHSFTHILIKEAAKEAVRAIYSLALAILTLPIAVLGGLIRLAAIPCMASPQKRALRITEIDSSDQSALEFQTIGKVARQWQGIASEKGRKDSKLGAIFRDSETINKLIAQCIEKPKECASIYNRIFVCRDLALNYPQATALIKNESILISGDLGNYLKIAHLATHPGNIRSKANVREHTRVEGAASAVITHLAQICLQERRAGIYLEAVESAIPFYKKMGFEELDRNEIVLSEDGTYPMRLTAERIRTLASYRFSN